MRGRFDMDLRGWLRRLTGVASVSVVLSVLVASPAVAASGIMDSDFQGWVTDNQATIKAFANEGAGGLKGSSAAYDFQMKLVKLGRTYTGYTADDRVITTGSRAETLVGLLPDCKDYKTFIANDNCPGWGVFDKKTKQTYWIDGKNFVKATVEQYAQEKPKLAYPAKVATAGVSAKSSAAAKTAVAQRVAMATKNKAASAVSKVVQHYTKDIGPAAAKSAATEVLSQMKDAGFKGGARVLATSAGKLLLGAGDVWFAQQVGTFIGSSITAKVFGGADNVAEIVCNGTNDDFIGSAARYFSGVDCSKLEVDTSTILDTEVPKGGYCNPRVCVTFTGEVKLVKWSNGLTNYAYGVTTSVPSWGMQLRDASVPDDVPDYQVRLSWSPATEYYTSFDSKTTRPGKPFGSDWTGSVTWANPSRDQQNWEVCTEYADGSKRCSTSGRAAGFALGSGAANMPTATGTGVNDSGSPATAVTYNMVDQDTGAVTASGTQPTTQEFQQFASENPSCVDGLDCELDLRRNEGGLSCFDLHDVCADWASDPTAYTCTYGGKTLDITECTVYKNSFKAETKASGKTGSDPATGEPIGDQVTDPASDADTERGSCWSGVWSWNPLDWVLTPVKCALKWAFVPDQFVVTEKVETLKLQAQENPVAALVAVLTVPNAAGCGGILVDVPVWENGQKFSGTILNSCDPELSQVAGWTSNLIAVLVVAGGVLVIARLVAGTVGYVGVKSSGGE